MLKFLLKIQKVPPVAPKIVYVETASCFVRNVVESSVPLYIILVPDFNDAIDNDV